VANTTAPLDATANPADATNAETERFEIMIPPGFSVGAPPRQLRRATHAEHRV
jgi:hypothetical protein